VLLRVILFIMLGLGVTVVGGLSWTLLAPTPSSAPPPPLRTRVLAAATALRAGTLIKPQDLDAAELLPADVPADATRDSPAARAGLTGAMILHSMVPGQPILSANLVRPGDHGFLAAVLSPGLRAVTVAVDSVSGTAGLIWPGDRVDVVLTQTMDDALPGSGHRVAAQTVLSDTRVIAIDQQLVQGQLPDGVPPPANRTATLEVTASQVERILVAVKLGHLSLSVLSAQRPPEDPAAASSAAHPPPSVTWASDVSPAATRVEPPAPPIQVHVFQGSADDKEFHF
jgi:pilus assembly protein CpaB